MSALEQGAIEEYLAFACRLAEIAGAVIMPHFRAQIDVENKAARGYDPVTIADKSAEEAIRREIARAYPAHGIVGEEQGSASGTGNFTWVIDPIDGTRSFILGQLHWGTMIALNDGTRPIIGVVHQPYVGETFVGAPGRAELRRAGVVHAMKTRRCGRLEDAALGTTHPDVFRRRAERAAFDLIASKALQTRYGGDCYSYCLLAAGLIDLVIESSLGTYDVQPLVPIIEGAGGVITNWSGGTPYAGGQVVAAGDPELHRAALAILSLAAS